MLNDWIHWLSSLPTSELVLLLTGLLLFDAPRYAVSRILLCLWHCCAELSGWLRGRPVDAAVDHCPSVCVVLAGYNEAATVTETIGSFIGTYPKLEIIIVDDGSEDGMAKVARREARRHANVMVLCRTKRGGKSSALNFALSYTQADVIIGMDCDTHLCESAIWRIVQPFADDAVGATSGNVLARNCFTNLATRLQAYEYLNAIFVGRMVAAWMGILSIASGAFCAIRRDALQRLHGWDVGPGEDLDLVLRLRKCGYKIAFAPSAQCLTDVPESWSALWKQRLRWDEAAAIRNHCRKQVDLLNPFHANFRWSNFFLVLEACVFNVICAYGFLIYALWLAWKVPDHTAYLICTLFLCGLIFEFFHCITVAFYSFNLKRDAMICVVLPLVPAYQMFLIAARIVANTRELFWRKSFDDNFVPGHVRAATWRW